MIRVGLAYDLRDDYLAAGYGLEETAEFDRPDTIAALNDLPVRTANGNTTWDVYSTAAKAAGSDYAVTTKYSFSNLNADKQFKLIATKELTADEVVKAEADTKALIKRREKMAEDKIAAAERGAVAELRTKAANAAASAARQLISANHNAKADKALVDEAIGGI